KSPSTCIFNF
ncbi:cell cycle family protein, partial [Chlamydia psittaci 84-8471/1]